MLVNDKIRDNAERDEIRGISKDEASKHGGYCPFRRKVREDSVRLIRFGESIELCGGTHAESSGQIGFFKIISESAIAAGIRRIEAISGSKAFEYISDQSAFIRILRA
ncbi:MAG: hypothetical protein MZV63_26645 [Marinilabiliales bacterium]|nr:hypothetical protein [Marinilabiliales bacterium]